LFENFFDDLAEKKKQETKQEIEEFCEKLFAKAKKELSKEMSFLNPALGVLPCSLHLEGEFLAIDGKQISYHPLCLYYLYKRSLKLVNRACLHMVSHCLFKHLWKQKSDARLWGLSCDIAVEWLMDNSVYSCLATPQSIFRQETYKRLRKEEVKGVAEDIYDALSRWNLQEEEVAQLIAEYRIDEHEGWGELDNNLQVNAQIEKKWQKIKEKMEKGMEFFAGDFDSEGKRFLSLLEKESNKYEHTDYCFDNFLDKFRLMNEGLGVSEESMNYGRFLNGSWGYHNLPLMELQEGAKNRKSKDFVVVIDTKAACAEDIIERFIEQVETTLPKADSYYEKTVVHLIRWNEKSLSWGREDFRPAFTYIEELLKKGSFSNLKGLLYFTDRAGHFPQRVPSYRTAFVFANRESQEVQVPPWAMKIIYQ